MRSFERRVLILIGLLLTLLSPMMAPSVFSAENFTIVVLPDTQRYSCGRRCASDPVIFKTQTKWIVNNKDVLNIAYVVHEGDIVQYAGNKNEWENANAAMSLLEDPKTTGMSDGIPYGVVPGNHDHPDENYNTYFGISRFRGRSYYGGDYGGKNNNNFTIFSAGGMDFIMINLDYFPPSHVLDWADGRLKEFSSRRAIVVSHHIISDVLRGGNDFYDPSIYENLKDNPNLFLMLCGHVPGEKRRTDTFNGKTIHTLRANYQGRQNGGDGWLRILQFSPDTNEIHVKTYSPTLDQYETDEDSQFTLKYDMGGVKPQG
jgi:hypothetical protein